MSEWFNYAAFGLQIRAEFALWPWGADAASISGTDVVVELASQSERFEPLGFRPGLQDAVLDWPSVAEIRVTGGDRIQVRPVLGATVEEVALITAGPALALLLEQRGHVVLHGSSVEVAGAAAAFLGNSGLGKSTIAATLRANGCRLISDGMTVVDVSQGPPQALPGPPHLKLWPDAIRVIDGDEAGARTRPIARQEQKRWYEAKTELATEPCPLTRVFLLERSQTVERRLLAPSHGLVGLLKNYFLADFADDASRAFMLNRCASVAAGVSIATLARGESIADLAAVVALLAAH